MPDRDVDREDLILDKINTLERNLNRRLDEQDAAAREFKAEVNGRLVEIKTQTTLTNGRVTALERVRERGLGVLAAYKWIPVVVGSTLAAGLALLGTALAGGFH
jgi:hypothetical protein